MRSHALQSAERAALACERAAQEMERACLSFDKANEVRPLLRRGATAAAEPRARLQAALLTLVSPGPCKVLAAWGLCASLVPGEPGAGVAVVSACWKPGRLVFMSDASHGTHAKRSVISVAPCAGRRERSTPERPRARRPRAQVLHTELPTTLDAMERASLEFDQLGRSLNLLFNPLRRLPARQPAREAPGRAAGQGAAAAAAAAGGEGARLGALGGVGIPLASLGAVTASGIGAVSGAGEAGGQAVRKLAHELAVLTRVRGPRGAVPRRAAPRLHKPTAPCLMSYGAQPRTPCPRQPRTACSRH